MINDVSRAFLRWLIPVTGKRTTGSYVDGRWEEDAPSDLSFKGVVQNATPKDLKVLEGGNDTDESIKIHTTTDLIAQKDDTTGDLIDYKGAQWLVFNVDHRFVGNYNKAIAVKQ